jgi:hypothetical protein
VLRVLACFRVSCELDSLMSCWYRSFPWTFSATLELSRSFPRTHPVIFVSSRTCAGHWNTSRFDYWRSYPIPHSLELSGTCVSAKKHCTGKNKSGSHVNNCRLLFLPHVDTIFFELCPNRHALDGTCSSVPKAARAKNLSANVVWITLHKRTTLFPWTSSTGCMHFN